MTMVLVISRQKIGKGKGLEHGKKAYLCSDNPGDHAPMTCGGNTKLTGDVFNRFCCII
jgi:hypothetical protein